MSHSSHGRDSTSAMPDRVLHLVKGLGPGGAERLLVNQLQTTDGRFDYTVARIIPGKHHLVTDIEATGARSVVVGGGRLWPLGLRALLRRSRPDVVHVHSPVLAGVVRLLRATGQIDAKIVTTEHNRWPRHHPLTRTLNRLTARIDDARIAVSEDVRLSMSPAVGRSTTVIDHGVPIGSIRALAGRREEMRARLLGERAGVATVIGIVANFRPEKGYDTFLDAVRATIDSAPDLQFLVVGQGPGEEHFRHEVLRYDLGDRIEVLGYRDDATEVMTSFDVFTLTSRHEGKPVSLMEALALGIPSVCTKAGGIPEVIESGVNGILVDIDDADGLADAWIELATDGALRDRLGQAAWTSAARFDASEATRSIESVYRDLLA